METSLELDSYLESILNIESDSEDENTHCSEDESEILIDPIQELISDFEKNSNKKYIVNNLDILPDGIDIFVITMTCGINQKFFIENILNYYPLNHKNIVTIKSKLRIRNIKKIKKVKKVSKKVKKTNTNPDNFFNQITVVLNIPVDYNSDKTKFVNLKLFKSGAIQISGLQSINQCNITINKILNLLIGDYGIFEDGIFKEIRFIESDEIKIINVKVNMINTMFQYTSKINRSQLYIKLVDLKNRNILGNNIRIKYQPDIHAPVHIKIDIGNKKPITVFVFESGKILIMAAKKRENIIETYNYINNLLTENHNYIIKKDLFQIIANDPELSALIDLEALAQTIDDF